VAGGHNRAQCCTDSALCPRTAGASAAGEKTHAAASRSLKSTRPAALVLRLAEHHRRLLQGYAATQRNANSSAQRVAAQPSAACAAAAAAAAAAASVAAAAAGAMGALPTEPGDGPHRGGLVRTTQEIALQIAPRYLGDVHHGIQEHLRPMLKTYSRELGGVPLNFQDVKPVSQMAKILYENPGVHVRVRDRARSQRTA
jgi:hypothetical protein